MLKLGDIVGFPVAAGELTVIKGPAAPATCS